MKKKTKLQKLAKLAVILLATNAVPAIACLAGLAGGGEDLGWFSNHPYLFGWAFNIGLVVIVVLMAIGFKLGEYAKTGTWNRKFFSEL